MNCSGYGDSIPEGGLLGLELPSTLSSILGDKGFHILKNGLFSYEPT